MPKVCRALKVLCAAPSRDRLGELKRATVSTNWELVGGAASGEEVRGQIESWRPDVLVIDAALGAEAVSAARSATDRLRVVSVGSALHGVDEVAPSLEDVRSAVLGLPRPGGPVR